MMQTIETDDNVTAMLREPSAVLLKHSTHCPISAAAFRQVTLLQTRAPETPVYLVDVHSEQRLSRAIAERLDIEHESPQAIVLRHGGPVWIASHYDITADSLEKRLGENGDGDDAAT
jgi:bacillithiol system protein YtxJ